MKIRKIIGDGNEQLIGGNFLNDTSGSYSSLSSFKLETNFTGKINTNYDNVLTSFSNPISLESINLKESDSELISTNKRVELNFDKSDLKSYIRFGSVVDYMKSAIHNIILDYPASLYIDSEEYKLTPLNTISDYIPNIYLNKSNFKINSNYVINKFGLIYNKDNLNIPDDNELRNLNLSYQDYVVYYNGGEYNILNFIGSYNGFIDIEVEGLPFGEETLFLTNKTFHIKPKPIIFNKIRKNFGKLENYFLQNRLSDNSGFEIIIKEPFLMDDGRITYQDRKLLWSTTDGYNIDYEGGSFNSFVDSLINISNNYDNTKTDLINRFLTPPSLKIYDNTQEKKIEKLLRIWGRNFDEIKQYIDALTKINKLSYDKKNNIPDVLVKNLARSFGWDDITLVKDDELINNFFAVDYEEKPTDFLPVEIDIELWRRILINTNFFWKTKGTRQAILAMFKLIGIPEPFINIKEYIYTVDEVINPDEVDLSLEDLYSASLPYTENGYPVTPIETNNFFFQISGDTDNGQHYMNNFRKSGFVLNQIEDNKKSWVYSGETIREHGSTVQYYQESSDLVLNTKQVDISLDIANAVEYDVFDYIKNVDYPNNSPEYAKKFTFVNINTDFETSGNTYELPEEPIGDVQVSLNGITLTNSVSGNTQSNIISYDNIFGTGFNNSTIFSLIQDSNNKYLIGGNFTTYNGITSNRIIRLNQDGSIDNTFNIGTGFNDIIRIIIEDSNGKYLIGGSFTTYNGTSFNCLIRLNQDGSIDNTFNIGTGFNNFVRIIIEDSNGKYLIGGNFKTYNGTSFNGLIRLNQDGSIDNTFNIGTGFIGAGVDNTLYSIIEDSNSKYLIGGDLIIYNGTSFNGLIRLNQDGSIDNTFNFSGGAIRSIIQDSSGKYVIGGNFTTYNGITSNRIIRLNQDGSIDNTFNIDVVFDTVIFTIIQDGSGKYVIGGQFGTPSNGLVRLNQNGSVDNSFNIGVGFNNFALVYAIIQDGSGKYVIGGQFKSYNNEGVSRNIIRLNNESSTGGGINIDGDYYIDENNSKLIHLNTNINSNDVIVVSYLFRENSNDENSQLLSQTIKYVLTQAFPNNDGSIITLPEEPNGDVQITMNGVSLSRSGDDFVGDYAINPNNSQQIFISNEALKNMILNNDNIVQLSYLTSETGYDLNQRSEFYKINNFNNTKLYFDTQINRFVYVLNLKVNNINDIRFTLNGITLSPEKEYQLSTTDKRNILLPPQIQIGDVLGFYYVTSESGVNDLTVPDSFGVGDISNLSFLEFVDLLEKKLINVKNRKVITDNKGGFYPTLLRVYIQYLKRSELDDEDILHSNGYTYDNLYEFLNKYNSFFYKFTQKLLPATVIYGKSGFMIRNTVFSKQKFTYKRGVALNIVDGVGVPNNDLEWLGTDGSEFKVLQVGSVVENEQTILIDESNTYYFNNGNCYMCKIGIKSDDNINISNKILVNGELTFDDNSIEPFTIIMDNINNVFIYIENLEKTPKNVKIINFSNLIGTGNYIIDNSIKNIIHNLSEDVLPTFSKISILNSTITQKESTGNNIVDIELELNEFYDGIELEVAVNTTGFSDNTFNIGTGFNDTIFSIIEDSNNKYVIGGEFTTYQGITSNRIIRLNQDGSIDNTFNIGTGFDARISSIIEDSNSKYIIGGEFTTYQGITSNRIIRLNQDGSIDNTFNIGTGFNNIAIYSIIEDSNNKYVIGGTFSSYNGTPSNGIIRLNQDGSIDNTFNIGTGFNYIIDIIIEDSNNKYVVGGNFTTYNGTPSNGIIRLNQDGSIDNTFNIGTGFNSICYRIIQDNNGKYVIGGSFTTYNGSTYNKLIRLNQDGSIDNTFNIGTGFDGIILHSIIEDSNNKYVIGGGFTTYNGTPSNKIIRLNQDGSVDNIFNIRGGFNNNNIVQTIVEDSNNKYIVGGSFTTYDGTTSNRIIRLNNKYYLMNLPNDFIRNVNTFLKNNYNIDINGGGTISLNERIDNNLISCDTKYFVDNNEMFNYNFIPYIPQPTGDPFIFTVDTTLGVGNSFDLPLRSGYNYNMLVDWGDGSSDVITSYNQAEKLHTYSTGGEYQIKINGICKAWYFNYGGDRLKLTSIDQWGNTGFVNMQYAFYGCSNLTTVNDTDGTWCSNVTNMNGMFDSCSSLETLDVSNWDVSNVTNMQDMFYDCSSLTTLDVSNWNVSNVSDMYSMFYGCSSLTTLDVSNWNVSNVTYTSGMFYGCSYLTILDVSNWDVSNVTEMTGMFNGCSSLTTLDVSNWDVSNVTDLSSMFNDCSSLTTLNVSNWDVSNVIKMKFMFNDCSSLTILNVGNWYVSNVDDIEFMFNNTPLDTASYDALLIGWSRLPSLKSNLTFRANLAKYSSGAADARQYIIDTYGWSIEDGGQVI